jgi:hypothetical protein
METWVTVAEATEKSTLSHKHISYLAREKKITSRKAGKVWLIDLESLKDYERRMSQLGTQKHSPKFER